MSAWPVGFQRIAAAFLFMNMAGLLIWGPKFIVLGWLCNTPAGLFHYWVIEQRGKHGDAFGTAMIVAMPWAQSALTGLILGWALAWRLRYGPDGWKQLDLPGPVDESDV